MKNSTLRPFVKIAINFIKDLPGASQYAIRN